MKKAEEILEAYPELEYDDVIKAMKEYAKLAIEEQLDIAADCATVIREQGFDYYADYVVNKYSITNCTRVELK